MTGRVGILVVGAGVASASLVSQLRADGYAGTITVVDEDPDAPYDRPPLSKEFLASEEWAPHAPWWDDSLCSMVGGTVIGLNLANLSVTVHLRGRGARVIEADSIVLATGASPTRLPDLPQGVLHLRTAADARELRERLVPGARIAILGAGTIGTELASSARSAGAAVTVIDLADRALNRFLAGYLADEVAGWMQDGGVDLLLGHRIFSVEQSKRGWQVTTDRASVIADIVVSAVGTRPNVAWLHGSRLDIEGGIRCDREGRALDLDGEAVERIYAIGDVASWDDGRGGSRRREDWTSAQRQGREVARALLGLAPLSSRDRDYYWTHQFGRKLQILGDPNAGDELVTEMTNEARRASFHVVKRRGEAVAWIAINAPREFALAMRHAALADAGSAVAAAP